ncbi:MAG TPA: SUMF1/EgtB/PvdO family nonheme iron enzyme, partial [Polyangia bacterium]|nr:SUMF1/EgtB/PvdO family nonheme iron enzyme [Polyangia bacterium]
GDTVLQRLNNINEERFQPLPDDRKVPAWVRRAVLRGLKADPARRWPSMAPLIAALEDDPPARHRRRFLAVAVIALVAVTAAGVTHVVRHHRLEIDRQVSGHLHDAALAGSAGRAKEKAARELRRRAFQSFDAAERARGEELWREALALVPAADSAYERAERAYEMALVLDPGRADVRAELADLIYQQLLFARELRRNDQARALGALLERDDEDGHRRAALQAPGTLALRTTPDSATVFLDRYEREPATGRRMARPVAGPPPAPGAIIALEPGSYRARVGAPGYADVAYPFELSEGEHLQASLRLPQSSEIPKDFVFIPAGEFWFGDADENLRNSFLDTVPLHRRHSDAFLIARHETTYREWIDFLTALPEERRGFYAPQASAPLRGSLRLRQVDGDWQLTFQPTSQRYSARQNETFVYVGRDRRTRQDWLEFPVAGTAPVDVERYLRWLRETGRVPGARLCTEVEWERAARGADDRVYPHGDELGPDDANFDVTYGRVDSAFGPDMVGAHPASQSPFGVDDLAGNVLELVRSSLSANGLVIRGGAYYFNSATCRVTNRNQVSATFRDVTSGIRVCAPAPETP